MFCRPTRARGGGGGSRQRLLPRRHGGTSHPATVPGAVVVLLPVVRVRAFLQRFVPCERVGVQRQRPGTFSRYCLSAAGD